MATTTTTTITLSPTESLFRRCLLDCRNEMSHVAGMKDLELRWTGGWVRDKLLGQPSIDIDVALSTMTGMQFGQALQEYISRHGQKYISEAESHGIVSKIKDLHKIAANPDKSKHLETITTSMFGIDVDFVNLRKEVYDETSRNPQMQFGTAEEDALRRDATVNALFYNLDTQLVEDYTGQGLDDMQKRIIRTPLPPYQTFRDDPLRVLRLIRFASRLAYTIEDDALHAMADGSIHQALKIKISRERVGKEVEKTMAGPDAHRGMMLIYNNHLFDTVFDDPASPSGVEVSSIPRIYDGLHQILAHARISGVLSLHHDKVTTWTLATYVPWKDWETAAVESAWEAIKATTKVTKVLASSIRNRTSIQTLAARAGHTTRQEMGMALRRFGSEWRFQVLYAMLDEMASTQHDAVLAKYLKFLDCLDGDGLLGAAEMKQVLNGNEIMKIFEVKKAGKWLKHAGDMLIEWQFENPRGTNEEAMAMLLSRRDELQFG